VEDWSQGIPLSYVQELCRYWQSEYEMRRLEKRLNAHPQFKTMIDGVGVHFLHVPSPARARAAAHPAMDTSRTRARLEEDPLAERG
jgi:hypothetical protein